MLGFLQGSRRLQINFRVLAELSDDCMQSTKYPSIKFGVQESHKGEPVLLTCPNLNCDDTFAVELDEAGALKKRKAAQYFVRSYAERCFGPTLKGKLPASFSLSLSAAEKVKNNRDGRNIAHRKKVGFWTGPIVNSHSSR
jgi:hypothetical protein